MPQSPRRVIGYVRVSTDRQAQEGESLEVQDTKVRALAALQDGAELLEVVVDGGESASSLNRPGVQRVLSLVRARAVDVVLVAKLDRLTRNLRDLLELLELFDKRGVALVSAAESLDTRTAAGRLVVSVLGAFGQFERERIGERVREVLQHKRRKGERVGSVPYGFTLAPDGSHLYPHPAEQATLRRLEALRASGLSLRAAGAQLTREGHRTRRGGAWNVSHLHGLCTREPVVAQAAA